MLIENISSLENKLLLVPILYIVLVTFILVINALLKRSVFSIGLMLMNLPFVVSQLSMSAMIGITLYIMTVFDQHDLKSFMLDLLKLLPSVSAGLGALLFIRRSWMFLDMCRYLPDMKACQIRDLNCNDTLPDIKARLPHVFIITPFMLIAFSVVYFFSVYEIYGLYFWTGLFINAVSIIVCIYFLSAILNEMRYMAKGNGTRTLPVEGFKLL